MLIQVGGGDRNHIRCDSIKVFTGTEQKPAIRTRKRTDPNAVGAQT